MIRLFRPTVRLFHQSVPAFHGKMAIDPTKPVVKFSFIDKDGNEFPVESNPGENLLTVAHAFDVDLEGACEASLACSTCHVILPEDIYEAMADPTEEENDMLDLAFGLTET